MEAGGDGEPDPAPNPSPNLSRTFIPVTSLVPI